MELEVIPLSANGFILWEQVAQMSGGRLQWQSAADGNGHSSMPPTAREGSSSNICIYKALRVVD